VESFAAMKVNLPIVVSFSLAVWAWIAVLISWLVN
jgi:hypothetical protein